ncbi:palmitoyltransferase ZDHHC1 isoform X2 [Syngnathus scovelli]|uniref:palmitoyltransferase ZDHHC1 isoform X2 n=1 Tax=Syngnathus scovelli TaxID=161590 RepID=UPI00210FAD21|nr:palmitoyltransferase ZDHHC1 isoform X2 [Syngnathus scovelli]
MQQPIRAIAGANHIATEAVRWVESLRPAASGILANHAERLRVCGRDRSGSSASRWRLYVAHLVLFSGGRGFGSHGDARTCPPVDQRRARAADQLAARSRCRIDAAGLTFPPSGRPATLCVARTGPDRTGLPDPAESPRRPANELELGLSGGGPPASSVRWVPLAWVESWASSAQATHVKLSDRFNGRRRAQADEPSRHASRLRGDELTRPVGRPAGPRDAQDGRVRKDPQPHDAGGCGRRGRRARRRPPGLLAHQRLELASSSLSDAGLAPLRLLCRSGPGRPCAAAARPLDAGRLYPPGPVGSGFSGLLAPKRIWGASVPFGCRSARSGWIWILWAAGAETDLGRLRSIWVSKRQVRLDLDSLGCWRRNGFGAPPFHLGVAACDFVLHLVSLRPGFFHSVCAQPLCVRFRGPKSKHCSACNKCVADFDHHCRWLNNCVGSRNYKLFLCSVVSAVLGVCVLLAVSSYVLIRFFWEPDDPGVDKHSRAPNRTTTSPFPSPPLSAVPALAAVTGALALLACVLLCHLLLFHFYLMWNRLSTYEYIVRQRHRQDRRQTTIPDDVKHAARASGRSEGMDDSETPGYTRPQLDERRERLVGDAWAAASPLPNAPPTISTQHHTAECPPYAQKKTMTTKKKRKMGGHGAVVADAGPDARCSSERAGAWLPGPPVARPPRLHQHLPPSPPVRATAPPAEYHSDSAESLEEVPMVLDKLGSRAPWRTSVFVSGASEGRMPSAPSSSSSWFPPIAGRRR